MLRYDSIHGRILNDISAGDSEIIVDGRSIPLLNFEKPADIPWESFGVEMVVECSGKFKTTEALLPHLKNEVKKVILSVPPQDDDIKMIVLGVNEHILTGEERIISNASCTTNNAAPMLKVIHDHLKVTQAYITTVHSYTSDQSLHDKPHKDLRRSRAAAQSIIPTTTGAAKALTGIFPDLSEVIGGCGIRVPVPNGSLTDMTLNVEKSTSIEEVIEQYTFRRDLLVEGLEKIDGVKVANPKGAFYCIAELPIDNADDFAKWLLEEFEDDNETIMVAPAAGFYSTPNTGLNQVRIAYVLKKENLERALVILEKALKQYNNKA